MIKDKAEYFETNFKTLDQFLVAYEEFGFIIPTSEIKINLRSQLQKLLHSLLEGTIKRKTVYIFLKKSLQIASHFSNKESQDLLESFASDISEYNQDFFIKISLADIIYDEKLKLAKDFIIEPVEIRSWIRGIRKSETIIDFLNGIDVENKLKIYLHNQMYLTFEQYGIRKREREAKIRALLEAPENAILYLDIFEGFTMNRLDFNCIKVLASHSYLTKNQTAESSIFSQLHQKYTGLLRKLITVPNNTGLSKEKIRTLNRIYLSLINCYLCTENKSSNRELEFTMILFSDYQMKIVKSLSKLNNKLPANSYLIFNQIFKTIPKNTLEELFDILYHTEAPDNNTIKNDWIRETYKTVLESKLQLLNSLEREIKSNNHLNTDYSQRILNSLQNNLLPNIAGYRNLEEFREEISIYTDILKNSDTNLSRIIKILGEPNNVSSSLTKVNSNFLLISQLLYSIPIENNHSQFLLSTLLKKLATSRISNYQDFFKEIINNLLQAISGISDPTLKEEMLSLLYASIWDYDKDFIKELGEFSNPDNQHHKIDKEILKEITNLVAIASKAKEGVRTLFRKVELENLSEEERLLYYQTKFNSKKYDFKEWFKNNYYRRHTIPTSFTTSYFVRGDLVSDKNIFYKLAAFERGGRSIDSDFVLEQIPDKSSKEIFSEIYQDFHQLSRRYIQIKNTSNIMKKVVWQSINNELKLPWTSLLILDDSNAIETFNNDINDFHKFVTYKLLEPGYYTSKPLEFKNIFMNKLINALNDYKEDVEDPIRTYIENVDSSLIDNDKIGNYEKKLLHKKLTYLIHSHYGIGSEE
ncbi:TPA: hypothetical protein ACGO8L_001333 [Streptococcus suis]